jgi:hypothetical protein
MVLLAPANLGLESHGGKDMRGNPKSQIRNPKGMPASVFEFRIVDFGLREVAFSVAGG